MTTLPQTIALVGTGVIGRGWIRVFARTGRAVRLFDRAQVQLEAARAWLDADLKLDVADGLISQAEATKLASLVSYHSDLAAALQGAEFVQESAPEKLEIKQAIYAELDSLAAPDCIIASSTSALPIEEIAGKLPGARRCIMTHPFNPPHIVPAVEILPTAKTEAAVIERTVALMKACGQVPVMMHRFVPGFLGNRLQAAVVREALHLVESGVAEPEAVDAVLRDGLALRWAAIGNFGANHTNADGGIAQYFERYGEAYSAMMADLDAAPPSYDVAVMKKIGKAIEAREAVHSVAELCRKRDTLVQKILKLRRKEGGS